MCFIFVKLTYSSVLENSTFLKMVTIKTAWSLKNGKLIVVCDGLPESTYYHLCWITMITSTCCKNIVPVCCAVLSGKFTEAGPCACAFQCGSREHWIRSMCLFTHLSDELNEQYWLCQSSTFYNCSLGQQSFQTGLYQFVILLATFPPYHMFLVSAMHLHIVLV